MAKNRVAGNTFMLYLISFAKLIFPLLTLPYLTRILSEETYGLVSYVKSCMTYMQLIVDFGFLLSSVKDIVNAGGDKKEIGRITGNTICSKLILSLLAACVLLVMCLTISILQLNILFVILSFITVATSAFMGDFFFRGIEKMHYITIIYLISKAFSVALTFVFVRGDGDILWIPVLDIAANVISAVITIAIWIKMRIPVCVSGLKDCFGMLKNSFVYFLSDIASTAFSALNTVLIGIFITDLTQVAYWSLILSIMSAIQGLYAPICNGVYPYMIQEKSLKFIRKVLLIFMPIVTAGCIFSYAIADIALLLIGGEKYVAATPIFRLMIPVLFISFPVQILGWPTLGAIGKAKETTVSTVIGAVAQVIGFGVLVVINQFNLIALAILRSLTELVLLITRAFFTYKNRNNFVKTPHTEEA